MNKNYPVIVVPDKGKSEWYEGAYCLFFIYSKNNGNFILKGYYREVKEYLYKNYNHFFYYISFWCNGKSRGYWRFWKTNVDIYSPRQGKKFKNLKYKVKKTEGIHFMNNPIIWEKEYKRLPNRWISDFDNL